MRGPVEVQDTLTGAWCAGFEATDTVQTRDGVDLVQLRRISDGTVLPSPVPGDRVRPAPTPDA